MPSEVEETIGKGLLLVPGIGAAAGFVGGLLNNVFGGTSRDRLEDPITTRALKLHEASRQKLLGIDPEANRRMTDQSLSMQQGAAVQNALNASQSNLANQGVGGDIAAPMTSAIANSTAAVGAAGQFAGARADNNQRALSADLEKSRQLEQNAVNYGNEAEQVNLIESQNKNAGGALLSGLQAAGGIGGIFGQLDKIIRPEQSEMSASITPESTPGTKITTPLPDRLKWKKATSPYGIPS